MQPVLTRQVQQLEAELGCTLFARVQRGGRLTEAGQVFLAEAQRLLADLGQSVDRTRRVAHEPALSAAMACAEALVCIEMLRERSRSEGAGELPMAEHGARETMAEDNAASLPP